jgi:hypothetical protein
MSYELCAARGIDNRKQQTINPNQNGNLSGLFAWVITNKKGGISATLFQTY